MADLDRSRRPNGSSTTRWLRRRRLRPPDDVQRDGLVGVATEAFHFEVMVAGVQRVTEGRGWLGRTLVAKHPHVPSLAGELVGFLAGFRSALRFSPDRAAVNVFAGLGGHGQECAVILRIGKPLRIAGVGGAPRKRRCNGRAGRSQHLGRSWENRSQSGTCGKRGRQARVRVGRFDLLLKPRDFTSQDPSRGSAAVAVDIRISHGRTSEN